MTHDESTCRAAPGSPPLSAVHAETRKAESGRGLRAAAYAVGWTLIFASFAVRVVHLACPLLEAHGFRQTQTAITVWTFVKEGISLWNYQTPVFGPPWQVPFEFPIFQATAALIAKCGVSNLDVACRLTNILYFYLSALFLFLLCRGRFEKRLTTWCILLFYLWAPYTIFWSRTCMIDYASVAFALAYVHYFLRWMDRQRAWMLLCAIVFGSLGFLTKITTMAIAAVPLAYFVLQDFIDGVRRTEGPLLKALVAWASRRRLYLILLPAAALVPFLIGRQWVVYSDAVKASSPFTRWLASGSSVMKNWNFGTLPMRAEYEQWERIFNYARRMFLPHLAMVLVPLWCLHRYSPRERRFVWVMILGGLSAAAVFFNLYRTHDYYLIAISPLLCIVVGVGIHQLFFVTLRRRKLLAAIVAGAILLSFYSAKPALKASYAGSYDHPVCRIGRLVQQVTPEDEYVIVMDRDWSSEILYYAGRKGFMVREPAWDRLDPFYADLPFTTLVWRVPHPRILGNWRTVNKVAEGDGFAIYKLLARNPQEDLALAARFQAAEQVCLQIGPGSDIRGFRGLHQSEVSTSGQDIVIRSSGIDPYMELPPFDVPEGKSLLIRLEITSPAMTPVEFFYAAHDKPGFPPSQSVRRTLRTGRNTLYLAIPGPRLAGRLRLDPGTAPGDYLLHCLEVRAGN